MQIKIILRYYFSTIWQKKIESLVILFMAKLQEKKCFHVLLMGEQSGITYNEGNLTFSSKITHALTLDC